MFLAKKPGLYVYDLGVCASKNGGDKYIAYNKLCVT